MCWLCPTAHSRSGTCHKATHSLCNSSLIALDKRVSTMSWWWLVCNQFFNLRFFFFFLLMSPFASGAPQLIVVSFIAISSAAQNGFVFTSTTAMQLTNNVDSVSILTQPGGSTSTGSVLSNPPSVMVKDVSGVFFYVGLHASLRVLTLFLIPRQSCDKCSCGCLQFQQLMECLGKYSTHQRAGHSCVFEFGDFCWTDCKQCAVCRCVPLPLLFCLCVFFLKQPCRTVFLPWRLKPSQQWCVVHESSTTKRF